MKPLFKDPSQGPAPGKRETRHPDYLAEGSVLESLDGEPIDFSNMEITTIESEFTSDRRPDASGRPP